MQVKKISIDEMHNIVNKWIENNDDENIKGLFYAQTSVNGRPIYVACDNENGDCYMEEFTNSKCAIDWLKNECIWISEHLEECPYCQKMYK